MFLKGRRSLTRDPRRYPPDFYEDTVRAQRRQELHRQIATNIDSPAQLADSGEELRDFLGTNRGQIDREESVQAGPARWRALAAGDSALARKAKDCD